MRRFRAFLKRFLCRECDGGGVVLRGRNLYRCLSCSDGGRIGSV